MINIILDIKRDSKETMYYQIYKSIGEKIINGDLKKGEKLPSKRELSGYLKISQNTIDTAYQMLVDEGYIDAKARSGFYINELDLNFNTNTYKSEEKESEILNEYKYNYSSNGVSPDLFPFVTWGKLSREIISAHKELLQLGDSRGDGYLRNAISDYINKFRGGNINDDNIVIGTGINYLLMIINTLISREKTFALENPGYPKVIKTLNNLNRKHIGIDVLKDGIDLKKLEISKCDIVYITPSHQYPTGVLMPINKRLELIKWANKKIDRYIIEDDYDSEFKYEGRPAPALLSLDTNDKVIYMGTFSRSIAPSIRVAYMVLPKKLMKYYKNKYEDIGSSVPRFEQHTLCRFIKGGYFQRHLNRSRKHYKKTREEIIKGLTTSKLKKIISISGGNTGMHFLLSVNNGMSEKELIKSASNKNVKLLGISECLIGSKKNKFNSTVIFGFGLVDIKDIYDGIKSLEEAWL